MKGVRSLWMRSRYNHGENYSHRGTSHRGDWPPVISTRTASQFLQRWLSHRGVVEEEKQEEEEVVKEEELEEEDEENKEKYRRWNLALGSKRTVRRTSPREGEGEEREDKRPGYQG